MHTRVMTTSLESHPIHTWLTDMDGVLVHEENALPGADEFIRRLGEAGKHFLCLLYTSPSPRDS